jgi:hypothetical protein
VGALAIYLEDAGIATVQVSLVREHTEALAPPRALWVPFMLGRPLGAPDDPAFQKRVMLAALRLLERNAGPVLENFADDAPEGDALEETGGAACPVSFAPTKSSATLIETVIDEIAQLRMWHELTVRRRGRTVVGVTGLSLEELVQFIGAQAKNTGQPSFREGLTVADALRLACEELKTFYFEARAAQPGSHTSTAIRDWFWGETTAGSLLLHLYAAIENDSDPLVKDFARSNLIPRAVRYAAVEPKTH